MKALIVSGNGGFTKMHEAVIPVVKELGMPYEVVFSQAEARAEQGWDWALVDWLLPLNPRPSTAGSTGKKVDAQTTAVSVPGMTGTSVGSSFANCLPLLKEWSASRPDARMLVIYRSSVGMAKEQRAEYLAIPGVKGVFGYSFTPPNLKQLKKTLSEA